ncbi:MAG: fructosamine kinase family protein [Chloroflexi bacterium]|nr:fructosamine kinase family protein [Chloroflexota bacterium]
MEEALGIAPAEIGPLSGGCVGDVYRVALRDGSVVVAKVDGRSIPQLETEGYMLRYLAEHSSLPAPAVLYCDNRLLVMEFLPGDNVFSAGAQRHAAELLAELHNLTAPAYGLERESLIGGLHQPNPWNHSWLAFFREQRLLYMGQEALRAGRLPAELYARLERFAGRLEEWLAEPERPALIHGDAWTGNILAVGNRITGFLDPAIYYADAEIELAFTTLFGTFGEPFFSRYQELRPLRPGFMEIRRNVYNLYPLLVHVRLFGGGYVQSVERTLRRFGC